MERKKKNKTAGKVKRVADIVISAFFVVVIVTTGVFAFVLPKQSYSESEKRKLATFPEFTIESLFSGDFTDGFDVYFSDTFPSRDSLVDFAGKIKQYRGVRAFTGGKTIYSADDSMFSSDDINTEIDESKFSNAEKIEIDESRENIVDDDFVPGEIGSDSKEGIISGQTQSSETTQDRKNEPVKETQKPVGAQGPAGEKRGSLYVVGNTALELYRGNEASALAYAELINSYAKYLPENVNIYNMVVPTHTEFALPLSDRTVSNEQRPVLDTIRDNLSERVISVDPYNTIREHYENGEYLYFRSDHHWTALGAYYAYTEFCAELGVEAVPLSEYESGRIEPFLGTFYQSSRDASLLETPDYVDYYKVDLPCTVTRYDNNGQGYSAALYYTYVKGEANAYLAFLGGDFPYIKAVTENKNGRKLIVFKESYGNPLIPFLAPHFEEIHIADIRYFPYNAVNFISQYGITDALFVNGLMSASTAARINEMYALLTK